MGDVVDVLKLAAIPVTAGVIGYATNWVAVQMMFRPLRFVGVGPLGWQGVIPSKAAKMGSISVDKGLSKLGSLHDFYCELEPDRIAEHVVASSRAEVRAAVERIVRREDPQLWNDLPPRLREAVHDRVEAQLPELIAAVTEDIGDEIEHLMDLKLMVVRHLDAHPELVNRIFQDVGEQEFRFIVRSGLVFGFALGLVQMLVWILFPAWWILPLAGLLVGYITNWLALQIIFRPVEPVRVGPWRVQGLFLQRQGEVAQVYSGIIAGEVVTLRNIIAEMMAGPQSDRTRWLLETRLRPLVDRAVGRARPAVRLAVGGGRYDAIQESVAAEALTLTEASLSDPSFNRDRAEALRRLMTERMRALPAADFSQLLRSAFEEDEWQLIAVGAALGCLAGLAQVFVVFGGGG